jgi:uncharacterized membrane protein
MIRWIRMAAVGGVLLAFIGIGIVVGLILVANARWVTVVVPEWLQWLLGERPLEIWLPALIAGWLTAVLALGALLVWSMYYVWRRRQYESLIGRLEQENATLRNLPFTRPAPLEDLPEDRDEEGARLSRVAERVDRELQGDLDDAEM